MEKLGQLFISTSGYTVFQIECFGNLRGRNIMDDLPSKYFFEDTLIPFWPLKSIIVVLGTV